MIGLGKHEWGWNACPYSAQKLQSHLALVLAAVLSFLSFRTTYLISDLLYGWHCLCDGICDSLFLVPMSWPHYPNSFQLATDIFQSDSLPEKPFEEPWCASMGALWRLEKEKQELMEDKQHKKLDH